MHGGGLNRPDRHVSMLPRNISCNRSPAYPAWAGFPEAFGDTTAGLQPPLQTSRIVIPKH
jgi:hypothetical protein